MKIVAVMAQPGYGDGPQRYMVEMSETEIVNLIGWTDAWTMERKANEKPTIGKEVHINHAYSFLFKLKGLKYDLESSQRALRGMAELLNLPEAVLAASEAIKKELP